MNPVADKRATTLWTALAALLALHMLTTPFAVYLQLVDRGPTWLGLDDSARMALNYAWIKQLNWGHDIVYTYGPLSFLSTKVGWGVSPLAFLVADLFVVANFFFLFRDFILRSPARPLAAAVVILVTLTVPVFYGSGLAWVLMVFIFYWMHRSYAAPHPGAWVALTVLIALAFYLKLNTGLFTIVFLLGHLTLMLAARKTSWRTAGAVLVALAGLIWGGALLFHVSLPAYIKGAVEVVKGYNDLLYLYEDHPRATAAILGLFFGLCALLGLGLLGLLRRRMLVPAFLVLISVGYLYLLKKQALFRNDTQHLEEFFAYAPLVLLCGANAVVFPRWPRATLAGIGLATGACLVLGAGDRPVESLLNRAGGRYTVLYRYPREAAAYDPNAYADQAGKRVIPSRILARIGSSTVDVFPWDANYALQNNLTYHPRPCFQTFQANSDYLQQINYDFYERRGPRFVLYDYDAIDGAYPFNDAPTLHLFLARNYRIADSFTSNERWRIVLEKLPALRPVRLAKAGDGAAGINAGIPVKAPYLRLRVSYTLRGKLQALWDKPSPLKISYQRPGGEWRSYKTSTELLQTGLYTGHAIRSNEDFARFVAGDTSTLEPVQAVRVEGDPRHYRGSIGVEYFNVQ